MWVLKVRRGLEFGISGLKSSPERNDSDGEVEAWARSRVYTSTACRHNSSVMVPCHGEGGS